MGNFSSLGGLRHDTASVMAYAVVAQAGQMIDNGLKTAKNLANAGMRLPD